MFKRLKARIKLALNRSNTFAYISLSVFSSCCFLGSLFCPMDSKWFVSLSAIGCSGIVSVVVAWLLERSNDRRERNRDRIIINKLLYGFDLFSKIEATRALRICATYQDFDINDSYTISDIQSFLDKLDKDNVYFKGFSDSIKRGIGELTEVTLLSFAKNDEGTKLYEAFLALREVIRTLDALEEADGTNEIIKLSVIHCFDFIDDINKIRDKTCVYSISDDEKKLIISFRRARKRNEEVK